MINIGLIKRLVNYSLATPTLTTKSVAQQFKQGAWWTLYGSLLYELVRAAHMIGLYNIMTIADYGLLISFYSVMSLAAKVMDGGLSYSIAPFKDYCYASKQHFNHFVWHASLKYYGPLMMIGSTALSGWFSWAFQVSYGYAIVLWVHCLLSVALSCLRMMLYTVQHTRTTVLLECWSFLWYCTLVWTTFYCAPTFFTLNTLLCLHTIKYLTLFVLFSYQLNMLYHALPEQDSSHNLPTFSLMASNRCQSYCVRLGRSLFSRAFLTPFFALTINFYARLYHQDKKQHNR
jgi:O-antigen/teichoic acid export membrane protein